MSTHIRIQRFESLIQTVINKTIVEEVNDKSARHGRVTYVRLSNDLSIAKVFIECLDRTKIEQTVSALNRISGLFRSKVANVINTYKTPKIVFEPDKTIDYAQNIDKIIDNINKGKK